jgi:D-glycero-D-manno-heptose 1,7-bisphosphate phosphatase
MKTAIFLERDGILNVPVLAGQSQIAPVSLDQFKLNKQALPALEALKAAGFVLIVTTNQPGISTGFLPRRELDRMHDALRRALPVHDIFVCPHEQADDCPCRKPQPGMFTEAAFKWQLDLEHSFVISDKWQDARAARAVGCTSMMLQSPWIGSGHHDFVIPTLAAIADKIIRLQTGHLAA